MHKKVILLLIVTITLIGCGGGGGDSSTTESSSNQISNLLADTSEENSTRTDDLTEPDYLSYLNSIRTNAGMSTFTLNSLLEQSAYNHAKYSVYNSLTGHYESGAYPYYTGVYPTDRANYVGYKSGVSENISYSSDYVSSIDGLMTAIYHRLGFLSFTKNEVGMGMETSSFSANVYNMGNSNLEGLCNGESFSGYGTYYIPCEDSSFKIEESEYLNAYSDVYDSNPIMTVWPYDNQQNFQTVFYEENPDPLPDCGVTGNPISVQFNKEKAGNIEMVSFKLYDKDGFEISNTTVYDEDTDVNDRFSDKEFALFPMERLDWNSNYSSEFIYTEDGVQKSKVWSFKTREIEYPYYILDENEETFNVQNNITYAIYNPPIDCNDDRYSYSYSYSNSLTINQNDTIDTNTLLFNVTGDIGDYLNITLSNGRKINLIVSTSDDAL